MLTAEAAECVLRGLALGCEGLDGVLGSYVGQGVVRAAHAGEAVPAGALLSAGSPADAEAAVTGCPTPECRLVLARALFAQGRLKEAASAAGRAGELGPLAPYGQVLRGEALLLSGSPLDAVEPLRAASTSDGPPSLRASALLADALLTAGNFAAARQMAQRAASLPGQPVDLQAAMAWV